MSIPPYEREDIIGKWSLGKLELLRKYLAGYLTVLTKQSWCRGYEYIDAFAGTSKPKIKDEQIIPQLSYSSKKRAIAFIDPFGMQFEWETMEYLAKTKTVEVLLNFPVMAINRGVLRKHPERISNASKERLDRFLGAKDWMGGFYWGT